MDRPRSSGEEISGSVERGAKPFDTQAQTSRCPGRNRARWRPDMRSSTIAQLEMIFHCERSPSSLPTVCTARPFTGPFDVSGAARATGHSSLGAGYGSAEVIGQTVNRRQFAQQTWEHDIRCPPPARRTLHRRPDPSRVRQSAARQRDIRRTLAARVQAGGVDAVVLRRDWSRLCRRAPIPAR